MCYCAASCYLLQQPLFAIAALHAQAYVDHSIVTVLVENQTAITVWFHPSSTLAQQTPLAGSVPTLLLCSNALLRQRPKYRRSDRPYAGHDGSVAAESVAVDAVRAI